METLRTPDERFRDLPGYPFEPRYVEIPAGDGDRLRMHYVDEGPRDGDVVLMLHGEPSWSYLYRKMIPVVTRRGAARGGAGPHRLRPLRQAGRARATTPTSATSTGCAAFVEALDLRDITLVCQDWGGLIGLRLVAEQPERFARVVAANTFLPTGDAAPPRGVPQLARVLADAPKLPVGVHRAERDCARELPPRWSPRTTRRFPTSRYKAGARQFPTLVPIDARRSGEPRRIAPRGAC